MRYVFAMLSLLAIVACGADGEPIKPSVNSNVTLNQNGVRVGSNVSVGKGPFRINLGLGL